MLIGEQRGPFDELIDVVEYEPFFSSAVNKEEAWRLAAIARSFEGVFTFGVGTKRFGCSQFFCTHIFSHIGVN